jgi:hypothetical protein
VSDGLFNGAVGIMRGIEKHVKDGKIVYGAVYLQFDDPKIGRKAREIRNSMRQQFPDIHEDWTPIKQMTLTIQVTKKSNAKVSFNIFLYNNFLHYL